MKPQTLAFTGHRPESLPFGENELDPACVRIKAMMLDEIMNCAANNFGTFIQAEPMARPDLRGAGAAGEGHGTSQHPLGHRRSA